MIVHYRVGTKNNHDYFFFLQKNFRRRFSKNNIDYIAPFIFFKKSRECRHLVGRYFKVLTQTKRFNPKHDISDLLNQRLGSLGADKTKHAKSNGQ